MWFSRKHCHLPPVLQEMLFAKASKLQHSHPFYIGLSQTLTTMLKRVTLAEKSAATMLLLSQLDAHNTAHPSQTNDPFLYPVARFSAGSAVWNPTLSRDTRHSILLLRPLKLSTQVSLPQKLLAELMRVVFCGPRDTLWSHDFHHKTKYRSWPSQGVVLLMVATSKTPFIAPNSIQDLSKLEDVPKAEILRRRSSFSYFQQIDQATTCSGHPYSCLLHPPLHLHLRSLSFSWWIQSCISTPVSSCLLR